jgi:hypothetical protein
MKTEVEASIRGEGEFNDMNGTSVANISEKIMVRMRAVKARGVASPIREGEAM